MADKFITKSYLVSNLKNFKTSILDTAYATLSTTYTKDEVDGLVSAIPKFAIQVVTALPTTEISGTTVYLLKTSETATGNLYTEYIYVNNTWEQLGTQSLDLSGYYSKSEIDTELGKKVDKVSGKALSTNDYTNDDKTKLAGIAEGAEVNVQADWSVEDTTSDAYILNKPTSLPASDVSAWAKASEKPSYTATEVGAATASDISDAINALDVTAVTGISAGNTISAWSETDGKVSITTQAISITKSQVSDFPDSMPASNLTSTYNSTDTTNALNGVAVASAISGKADSSDVPSAETSNIDFTTEWDTTQAALG